MTQTAPTCLSAPLGYSATRLLVLRNEAMLAVTRKPREIYVPTVATNLELETVLTDTECIRQIRQRGAVVDKSKSYDLGLIRSHRLVAV